jgi:hypothetical protein
VICRTSVNLITRASGEYRSVRHEGHLSEAALPPMRVALSDSQWEWNSNMPAILTVNGRDYRKWELARSATLPVVGDRAVGWLVAIPRRSNGGGEPLARLF